MVTWREAAWIVVIVGAVAIGAIWLMLYGTPTPP
jgi:hypothetical protein